MNEEHPNKSAEELHGEWLVSGGKRGKPLDLMGIDLRNIGADLSNIPYTFKNQDSNWDYCFGFDLF